MLAFFMALPPCLVGMEACATKRQPARQGHRGAPHDERPNFPCRLASRQQDSDQAPSSI
jgi:transposase